MQAVRARVAAQALATVGGGLVLVGTFLPWLRSGRRSRSSYELYGVLRRLANLDDGLTRVIFRAWPLVPMLVTVSLILLWAGRSRLGVIFVAVTAVYVGIAAIAAWRTSLPAGSGILVSASGAVLMAIGGARVLQVSRRQTEV